MEKKTIGKFIAALRKANGMTQKELGEKLFVSDKTVSRWECDECTPELSLIPAIAELFGITTDELLRGERFRSDNAGTFERQNTKSDRQFRLMLEKNSRKYKNLTLISIGIAILGLIAALIADLTFSKGLIGFCLAAAFCAAGEICQICFAINARIMIDGEEDAYTDRIEEANTGVVRTAVKVSFVHIVLFAFCLPLVTLIDGANYGLRFGSWLGYGTLFAVAAFAISYVIYRLFVLKMLCDRRLIVLSLQQKSTLQRNNKLLKKTITVSVCIALMIGTGVVVLNNIGRDGLAKEMKFDTCAQFKAFVENDYEQWVKEGYGYIDREGNAVIEIPIEIVDLDGGKIEGNLSATDPKKVYEEIRNSKGEVLCEYYYNPDLYRYIRFTESAEDKMPVTVITNQAYYEANNAFQTIESTLYFSIAADFVVAAAVYLLTVNKRKRTA